VKGDAKGKTEVKVEVKGGAKTDAKKNLIPVQLVLPLVVKKLTLRNLK